MINPILDNFLEKSEKLSKNLLILLEGERIIIGITSLVFCLKHSLSEIPDQENKQMDIYLDFLFKSFGYEIKRIKEDPK